MKNEMKPSHLVVAVALLAAAFPRPVMAQEYSRRTQIDTTVRLDRGGAVDVAGLEPGNVALRITAEDDLAHGQRRREAVAAARAAGDRGQPSGCGGQ